MAAHTPSVAAGTTVADRLRALAAQVDALGPLRSAAYVAKRHVPAAVVVNSRAELERRWEAIDAQVAAERAAEAALWDARDAAAVLDGTAVRVTGPATRIERRLSGARKGVIGSGQWLDVEVPEELDDAVGTLEVRVGESILGTDVLRVGFIPADAARRTVLALSLDEVTITDA